MAGLADGDDFSGAACIGQQDKGVLINPNQNLFGFVLAQGEMITANLDLDWIAKGSETDQLDWSADQESHFHQARSVAGRNIDLGDAARCPRGKRAQWLTLGHQAAVR